MGSIVEVVPYDPEWPLHFRRIEQRLWPALQDLATSIEHVGSTSVPGLAAKPIIDMDVVVDSPERRDKAIEQLEKLGYRHQGNLEIPGREAFEQPPHEVRHHLYLCMQQSDALRNHLAIRDHLRTHPEDLRNYAELKRGLAKSFANDIDGYVEGKSEFLLSILTRRGFSAASLSAMRAANNRKSK
jgi:GrpB-like predicted nucleotidyltransferase (UPF0157 family)